LKASLRQANLTPTVSTQAYDIAWQNIDELNDQVKSLLDRNAVLSRMYNASLSSNVTKGDSKMFSEIPNNPDGDMFICQLRQYLNKESYKIRVRGQYLKDEVKETEGWKPYERGQPIEKSKCLRVYVDKK
jgi:long-subunit fatty acid transport protein